MKQNCSLRLVSKTILLSATLLLAAGLAEAQTATVLANFGGASGQSPQGTLIMDSSGNLYGTTSSGGTSGYGTVYELVNSSGNYSEKILYNFQGQNSGDGAYPVGGLIMDSSGNLYGTTNQGGTFFGTAFELVNSSGTYTEKVLHNFAYSDGYGPAASLIMDSFGNLYGTAPSGGTTGAGTVFELVNSSGTFTLNVLYAFQGKADGGFPEGSLARDSSGNLYGTTVAGGASGYGTVFELVSSSGNYSESVLYSFLAQGSGDGASPSSGVIMDLSGNLYGATQNGGALNQGTVFELAVSSGTYTERILDSFSGSDGANPSGGLIMDSSGNLYGTTISGGATGGGAIFELVNTSGTYSTNVLLSLAGGACSVNEGTNPSSGLLLDSSGNLYGTTSQGGTGGGGTAFKFTIPTGSNPTTTTLVSSANPATAGYGLQFTASVTSGLGPLQTGSVTFSEGSTILGTATMQCGSATVGVFDAAVLGIGTYTVTAQYTPALSAFVSSSGTLSQTVSEQGVVLTTGNNTLTGTETVNGSVDATSFVGNGSGLTNLNASGLTCTSCVGNMQLAISYAGSSTQGGPASNSVLFNGLSVAAFQPAGSYATTGVNLFTGAQSITGNLTVTGNTSTTGTTTLGTTGTPIVEHLSKQFNPTFTLAAGAACTSQVFTFTGAGNGDTVALGVPNQRMGVGDVIYTAWVSATNKVTIKVCAFATKPANLGSGLVRVDVWKH